MAIDTAAKRRSAATVAQVGTVVSVTPDASKDQAWRQAAGWGWYGIEVWEGAPGFNWPVWITVQARPTFTVQAKPIFTVQAKPTFTRS